jgi:hypothetical protein
MAWYWFSNPAPLPADLRTGHWQFPGQVYSVRVVPLLTFQVLWLDPWSDSSFWPCTTLFQMKRLLTFLTGDGVHGKQAHKHA